jgi:hypothetical protein
VLSILGLLLFLGHHLLDVIRAEDADAGKILLGLLVVE